MVAHWSNPPLADCILWVFCKTWQQWEGLLRPDLVCSIPNSPSMCSWLTSGRPNRLWQQELIYMMSKHIEMRPDTQSIHSVDWLDSYLLQHDVIHVQEVSALYYRCNLPRYKWNILKKRQHQGEEDNTNMRRTDISIDRIYVRFLTCDV